MNKKNTQAKTISLLLEDGTLNGLITIQDSTWNSGELYSAPRESVGDLLESKACEKFGVYMLLSDDMVYVGQASDLKRRVKQHIIGKDWWNRVIILTTSDDRLTRTDIDYLEAALIEKARLNSKLDCDNKTHGNKIKVDRFQEITLNQFLSEALFLIELIGINVFKEFNKKGNKNVLIETVVNKSQEELEIRAKTEAKQFLKENGFSVQKNCSYAKLGPKNEYWINPNTDLLSQDWDLILNNQKEHIIAVMRIPKNTFFTKSDQHPNGFYVRSDKPYYIDLNIDNDTFIDRRSKTSLEKFIIKKFSY